MTSPIKVGSNCSTSASSASSFSTTTPSRIQRAISHSVSPNTLEPSSSIASKTFVTVETLKAINEYLKEQSNWEEPKNKKRILKQVDAINNILEGCDGDYSYQKTKSLYLAFAKITGLFKQKHAEQAAELSYLTSKMLKTTLFEKLKQENIPSVIKEFTPYGEPGGTKSHTTSFSVSAGASINPASLPDGIGVSATVNAGYAHTKEYSADDEGLFFDVRYHKTSAGLSANANANINEHLGAHAKASLNSTITYASVDEFNDVRTFAQNEGTKLKDPDATRWQKFKRRFKTTTDMHRLRKLEQFTANATQRFQDLLKVVTQKTEFTTSFPEQNVPLPGYSLTVSGTAEASTGVSANLTKSALKLNASVSAGLSLNHNYTDIHQYVPYSFYDIVSKDTEKLKQIPKKLLRKVEKEPLTDGDKILTSLKKLTHDIYNYYETVQQYDYAVKSGYLKNEQKKLRQQKHKIEDKWGAIGRHQLLQTWSASLAYIAAKANGINILKNKYVRDALTLVDGLLSEPQITYDKSKILDIASFQSDVKLTISENNLSFEVKLPIFSGNITLTKRHREHPSLLRDGDYFDINITGRASLNASDVFNIGALSEIIRSSATDQGIALPDDFSLSFDVGVSEAINCTIRYFKPRYSQEEGFTGKKGWRKLFTRYRSIFDINTSIGTGAAVLPGIMMSGKVGKSFNNTEVFKEVIASDDIIYPRTRFNRYYRNNKFDPLNQDWKNFVNKHQAEFEKLFLTLGNKRSYAHKELFLGLNEAYTKAEDKVKQDIKFIEEKLKKALDAYRHHPNAKNYQKVLSRLSKAFGYMVAPWWEKHTSQWGKPEYIASPNSGLKFGSKVKTKLGLTRRGKVRFDSEARVKDQTKL